MGCNRLIVLVLLFPSLLTFAFLICFWMIFLSAIMNFYYFLPPCILKIISLAICFLAGFYFLLILTSPWNSIFLPVNYSQSHLLSELVRLIIFWQLYFMVGLFSMFLFFFNFFSDVLVESNFLYLFISCDMNFSLLFLEVVFFCMTNKTGSLNELELVG